MTPSLTFLPHLHVPTQGVHEILKDGGVFISISFDQPHFRKKYFSQLDEKFDINLKHKIEIGFAECYVYIFTKKTSQSK